MTFSIFSQVYEDCEILLSRALKNKKVSAFGADGNGQYGQSHFAKYFTISTLNFNIPSAIFETASGTVDLYLEGFDANDVGHVSTDNNLRISINKLFLDVHIDLTCWQFSDYQLQGQNSVMLDIDVNKLLAWE